VTSDAAGEFDPWDYATQDDPYPTYAWMRADAPLYRNERLGFWALSRHADVTAAARDEATYSNRMGVSLDPVVWGPNAKYAMSFLAMDAPEQTRLRTLVSRGFTPRRVQQLEPRIRAIATGYLAEFEPGASIDFIDDFAAKVPMDVISEMFGVPASDRSELRRLADLLVHREEGSYEIPPAGIEAAGKLFEYLIDLLARRRAEPLDDLTSALAHATVDGDRLSDQEILAFLLLMIVAGNETTTKLLGNAVYWAARNPEQWRALVAGDAPVSGWVGETLRYDSSTQLLARYLLRDVELHGRCAPAGSQLVLLIASANRDESVFPDADRYDVRRDTSQLASFGGGRHYCLGANLARLEGSIALSELLARVSHLEVDEPRAERVRSINVRGFAHLPVSVRRR
jgi:hypothetical protein